MNKFNKICNDIKSIKIQGADHIALAALEALKYKNDKQAIETLISLRPTEPKLQNALRYAHVYGREKAIEEIKKRKQQTMQHGVKILKQRTKIFTHCHSTTVMDTLKEANRKKILLEVFNTETRPLYQGRRTSKELADLKIPNTHLVDSAMRYGIKNSNLVLLGADAILANGKVINKIGSELVAETAKRFQKPLYICTSSWAFDHRSLHRLETPIEYRESKEIWNTAPKDTRVLNPCFEKIHANLIKGIISEFGILTPKKFVKRMKRETWLK